jgi:SRSO17 transposase
VDLESKSRGSESRFAAYVEVITSVLGHADRASPFRSYCAGLLLPGDRESVEPMAARVQPGRVRAAHQTGGLTRISVGTDVLQMATRRCPARPEMGRSSPS